MSGFITSAPEPDFDSDDDGESREWVHNTTTGDRGFLIEVDGKQCVQLDRVNQRIVKPFRASEWTREDDHRPLTAHSLAQVSYAADCFLQIALGRAQNPVPWISLKENDKLRWVKQGPSGKGPRAQLYASIHKTLGPLLEVD